MNPYKDISDAVAWTVYNTGLTPSTTVAPKGSDPAIGAQVGDLTMKIVPAMTSELYPRSRIATGSILTWHDGTDEEELTISNVSDDGTTVSFDFNALGYTGLQHDHAVGARVGTSCYAWPVWDISDMLNTGDPVFMCAPMNKGIPIDMFQGGFPVYQVHMQYHRQLYRKADGQKMDLNMWSKRQIHSTWDDLWAIEQGLLQNTSLITDYHVAAAQKLGRPNSGGDVITFHFDKFEIDEDTWHYVAVAELIVTGLRQRISNQ